MSRRQERQINKVLLLPEIREAEDEVVRSCQHEAIMNDYKGLVSGKPVWPKTPLFKCSTRMVVSILMKDCYLLSTCHMVYDFLLGYKAHC